MIASLDERIPSVFTLAEARALGLSDRQVYAWRDNGDIEILGHGIFARPGIEIDHDLIEISVRSPEATLCLTSGLARHDLIDDIPSAIHLALPREYRQLRTGAPARWHRFDASTFPVDRTQVEVGAGRTLGLYGPRRCIIDAFRLRHLYGNDQAVGALRLARTTGLTTRRTPHTGGALPRRRTAPTRGVGDPAVSTPNRQSVAGQA